MSSTPFQPSGGSFPPYPTNEAMWTGKTANTGYHNLSRPAFTPNGPNPAAGAHYQPQQNRSNHNAQAQYVPKQTQPSQQLNNMAVPNQFNNYRNQPQ